MGFQGVPDRSSGFEGVSEEHFRGFQEVLGTFHGYQEHSRGFERCSSGFQGRPRVFQRMSVYFRSVPSDP